jgi:hypothetical protein
MTTPFPFVSGQVLTAEQLNDIQNLPISDKTASYTLLVGDVTKRTIMNSASATTITVDDSIFTESDVIQVANKGAGTCTITAGAGVTINTSGSLDLAQYGGGYLVAISASQFVFFNLGGGGASYGTATGGSSSSITVSGVDYTLLSFTSDDNLVVSTAGLFDVLMIGGGGGGGRRDNSNSAGGGGAGGILQSTIYLDAATYAVDVGAGAAQGRNGLGSSVGNAALSLSVVGGGSGGSSNASTAAGAIGGTGGSGGGSTASNSGGVASINVVTGQAGGAGVTNAGGGGGGFTAVGGAGNGGTTVGGAGGAGYDVSAFISGSALVKAGGGGGQGISGGGAGGSGGGGAGGAGAGSATAGAANSGSGGGAGNTGAAGGSGIVYVRMEI